MSGYMADRIHKPPHFRISPLWQGRGKRPPFVVGFDSEATGGRPMLYQFSMPDTEANDCELREVPARKDAGLDVFMRFVHDKLYEHARKNEVIIYGYNLTYEFTQLFADLPPDLTEQDEFRFTYAPRDATGEPIPTGEYEVTVFNNKRYAVTIMRDHRRIRLYDAAAFFPGGLDAAGKMLGVGRKIDLSSKRFTRRDLTNEHFLAYSKQDAWLTRRVGETIIEMHETYDVPTCLSAPHFAARVFRRHFLSSEIPLATTDVEQAGLSSYHGGKNGYYAKGPQTIERIYQYDITSAYPEAMRALPDPTTAVWTYVTEYTPGVHALYKVTMDYKSCRYRGGMKHSDGWLETGYVDEVWLTSYELDAILERKEATLIRCVGYVMEGESGTGPLAKYVDQFFTIKRTAAKDGMMRAAAKLFLNSLYGKFFQKVALGVVGYFDMSEEDGSVTYIIDDPDALYSWQAGGLYHPAIASLITGFVRAKIHRLEHKYRAVMTSTDGFFAWRKPDPADIGVELGQLTVERGRLDIWRERLYDFQSDHRRKKALHAFRGDLRALRRIPLEPGRYQYEAQQMITLRLATRSLRETTYKAGAFAQLSYTLDLTTPP